MARKSHCHTGHGVSVVTCGRSPRIGRRKGLPHRPPGPQGPSRATHGRLRRALAHRTTGAADRRSPDARKSPTSTAPGVVGTNQNPTVNREKRRQTATDDAKREPVNTQVTRGIRQPMTTDHRRGPMIGRFRVRVPVPARLRWSGQGWFFSVWVCPWFTHGFRCVGWRWFRGFGPLRCCGCGVRSSGPGSWRSWRVRVGRRLRGRTVRRCP